MGTTEPGGSVPRPDSAGDEYAGLVDRQAIRRGHEVDSYDTRSVLSVPALVLFFFVLAFTVVTIVFSFISKSEVDPSANPWAVKQNEAPLNDRLSDIHLGGAVNQPRLEPLVTRQGWQQSITSMPTPHGNSPEIHPEDVVPSEKNTPELFEKGATADKQFVRIPLEEAMKMAESGNKLFPVRKGATEPLKTPHLPSESNAGRGFGPSEVRTPASVQPEAPKAEQPKGKQ